MTDAENRKHQMLVRVRNFCTARASDFGANSLATQLLAILTATITKIEGLAAAEVSGKGAAREGTTSRAAARAALRDDLEAMSRTARAIAHDKPGTSDKFRVPEGNNDQQLLAAARAFAANGAPLSADFIAHEHTSTFINELNSSIADLENAISHQSSAVGEHVSSRAALDDAIDEGVTTVRKLDPIMKNKYRDDVGTLAEWTSASHTERSPRHKSPTSPVPTPPSP